MSSHTSGPWNVNWVELGFWIEAGDETEIADITPILVDGEPDIAQTKANAYLVSAAPDLLHQLQHLVTLIEPLELDGSLRIPGLATLNGARAALAKAKAKAKP